MGAFHAYDIRGVYNVDFDKDTAYKVGYFIPRLLCCDKVAVGRDVRVSSPEIAKERVKEREAKGGHGVSEETVERRFGRSRENLDAALPLCDVIHIFDNTVSLKELCTVRDGKLEAMAECRWQEDERYAWLGKLLKRIGVE